MKTFTINSHRHGAFIVRYSDEDELLIKSMPWHIQKTNDNLFYVVNRFGYLHRFIMSNPDGIVDHIDRDTLNNTRENLRVVNASQSSINRRKHRRTNEYKGVDFVKAANKYRVRITINNKVIFGGSFSDKESAALKYNELASKYHGDFAILNTL